jgi:STE24 endopeptidase
MLYLFPIILFIVTSLKIYLNQRQKTNILINIDRVPNEFSHKISLVEHQKSANYSIKKLQFSNISIITKALLIVLFTYGGLLNYYNSLATQYLWLTNQYSVAIFVIFSFIITEFIIDSIFDYYSTFIIEAKFGFNKSTRKIFIMDHVKFLAGSLIIYIPFLLMIMWFLNLDLKYDWLLIWSAYCLFTFSIMLIYPIFIAPLFNKFYPLQDESLIGRINHLLDRCGFKTNGIYIMDGSKRSSHGNAYFTGIGKSKRIVFFDTLINNLLPEEVEAILAHELGHFKKNHIKKQIFYALLITLLFLFILSIVVKSSYFYQLFNINSTSYHNGILVIMLIIDTLLFPLKPIFSYLSRKNEFEADNFAKQYSNKDALISGLVKLYKDNASTLTPDNWYVKFYYSHPPANIRIANLRQ